MTTTHSTVLARYNSILAIGQRLLTALNANTLSNQELEQGFVVFRGRLVELPTTTAENLYLRNAATDAAALFAAGEMGAAKWQLQQVLHRLQKLRSEWQNDQPAGTMAKNFAETRKSSARQS